MPVNFDALLVSNPHNICYLSGFSGINLEEREAYLLLKKNIRYVIAPRLYEEEVQSLKSKVVRPIIMSEKDRLLDVIARVVRDLKVKLLGFESFDITVSEFEKLHKIRGMRLIPTDSIIERMRLIKRNDEIEKIKKAQSIGEKSFRKVLRLIKLGMTETMIRWRLEAVMKSLGAESASFDTIVAFGKNAALPHYKTGNTKIKRGSMLLFDFGARYKGYCGDMTRTIFIGKPTRRFSYVYNLVKEAQEKSLKKCERGTKLGDLYSATSTIFEKANANSNFTHNLGHGIGLQVHELPRVSGDSKEILKPGMVFSVEPGLYFPGWGGMRIEDLVAVRKGGVEILRKEIPSLISLLA